MRAGTPLRPQADPTGDLRATFAARLEYDLSPVFDERQDATYRDTPETMHTDRLRATRRALAQGRVLIAPAQGGTPRPVELTDTMWTDTPPRIEGTVIHVTHYATDGTAYHHTPETP